MKKKNITLVFVAIVFFDYCWNDNWKKLIKNIKKVSQM